MKYYSCCGSHIGRVRSNNEDNLNQNGWVPSDDDLSKGFVRTGKSENNYSVCVCDGMGGEAYGEKASRIAAETFSRFLELDSEERLSAFTNEANEKICKLMVDLGARIGTTFAGICFEEKAAYVSNLGDSKVFKIFGGKLEQLSVDHTELQVMLENNVITPEQAENGRFKNRLTQNLGIFEDEMILEPSFLSCEASEGDRFLVCSDGLTDMLKKEEILAVILEENDPKQAVVRLIKAALEQGGKDNITVSLTYCAQ